MTETLLKNNDWQSTPLWKVADIIDGDRGVNYPKNNEFSSGGYCLFLNTKNVPNTEFSFSELSFISREKDESMRKGKLKRGDFVLTTRGTIGNLAFYNDKITFENIRINSGMVVLRVNEEMLDKQYFYFYLRSPLFTRQVIQLSSGSAQPQLPIRDLRDFVVNFPEDIDEQKEIADVLSSLDNKIELLQRQNETLEQVARAIFHEWFVEFNFPNEKGHPYKASGGKMIESELGEIPQEWRFGKLADIIEKIKDRVGGEPQEDFTVMSAVNTGNLVPSEDYFTKQVFSKNISPYIKISQGDFAYNPARINIGSIGRLHENLKGVVSPVYVAFRAKNNYGTFVEFLIETKRIKRHVELFANGSVRQTLDYNGFASFQVSIPDNKTLKTFDDLYNSIKQGVETRNKQVASLQEVRDILLPKLMSGKIRVKI